MLQDLPSAKNWAAEGGAAAIDALEEKNDENSQFDSETEQ
jgi:hypothetical protein